ncbi:hypothetical protein SDC9_171990 [bioreactor metagenome]|uniref:Uncharacterized protein n=1 Tax=bioreactor metagenome TaxID=1076179 RepID=A0A645GCF6_9ZZZZ
MLPVQFQNFAEKNNLLFGVAVVGLQQGCAATYTEDLPGNHVIVDKVDSLLAPPYRMLVYTYSGLIVEILFL